MKKLFIPVIGAGLAIMSMAPGLYNDPARGIGA